MIFFFYICLGCLRPLLGRRVTGVNNTPQHPLLSACLLRDLQRQTIVLHPSLRNHIITWNQQPGDIDDNPLVQAFINTDSWKNFNTKRHRDHWLMSLKQSAPPPRLSTAHWKLIWSIPCNPQGRNLWYRLLLGKLYSNELLSRQSDHHRPSCQLCPEPNESLDHLIVSCPRKWEVWSSAFHHIMPTIKITPALLSCLLNQLDTPQDLVHDNNLWLLCGCGIQSIWLYH
ncbi:hypothetical protein BC941DRAFT_364788 [Chlamydoabsidia padenii]|nr:hypothetical protein BC941DRAFT_364788 [Chlamydoabsidia padenii]